jgi:hypothetical protein
MKRVEPGSRGKFPRPGRALVLHAAVLLAGVLCAFHPTLFSGCSRLQTDPGDTLLNHYILEHSWRWLTEPGYVGTLWSPPCFYPAPLTLAYSENLLGTAPLYWLFRGACGPLPAYAAWMIAVCALTYGTTAWALRRFGLGHGAAAFGAFVFAFGLPRVMQIGHQQLLPHLFAPLAVYAAWRLVTRPRLLTLAGLLGACFLQALCSICLGWFLHLGLGVFLVWLLATHRGRWPELADFVRRSWLPIVGLLAAAALLYALLLGVYRQANRGFVREWEECAEYLPAARDWLLPPAAGASAHWLGVDSGTPNLERACFPGWVVLGLVVLGMALALGRRALLTGEHSGLVLALLGTSLTLAVLPLRDLGGGGLWWCVYQYVPGATAIRAVGRVGLMVLLFALAGGLLALDALARAPGSGLRLRRALIALVLLAGALEQLAVTLPSFEAAPFYQRAEALGKKLRRGTAAYVVARPDPYWYTGELLAMWAGLYGNRPVVNGYSGRQPDQYPYPPMPPDVVFGWLAANTPAGELWQGRLLYVAPARERPDEYRTILLEATR